MATRIIVNFTGGGRAVVKSFPDACKEILNHLVGEGYVWEDDTPIDLTDRILLDHAAAPVRVYVQRDDRIRDTECSIVDIPPEIQALPEVLRLVRERG